MDPAKCDEIGTCSRFIYFLKMEQQEKGRESEMDYEVAREYMLSLAPSASDAELRSIAINEIKAKSELIMTIKFFHFQLESNRNFEHWQATIALFLRIHSDLIVYHSKSLGPPIRRLAELLERKWAAMNHLFQSNLCLIQFYSRLQQ